MRDNSIFSDQGKFILIDWDNARFNMGLWDYFVISSWWPINRDWKSFARRKKARIAFFEGYGTSDFTQGEIDKMQPAMHLLYYLELLDFFEIKKDIAKVSQAIRNILRN
jgi:thiamine kinase-like enzyme